MLPTTKREATVSFEEHEKCPSAKTRPTCAVHDLMGKTPYFIDPILVHHCDQRGEHEIPKGMQQKRVSKTQFVRDLPATMPAKEVTKRAKAAGLTISPGYVYEIRSSAKRKARGVTRTTAKGHAKTSAHTLDATFRKAILDLGLTRAKELIAQVEKRLGELVAGR